MLFDIIFGIFVAGLVGMSSNTIPVARPADPFQSQMTPPPSPLDPPEIPPVAGLPVPPPSDAPADTGVLPLPAAPAPGYVQDMILEQLACRATPDPTGVVMALMQEGMILSEERIAYESINCFPLHGGTAIAGMPFQMICVSVNDAEADQLDVVYQRDPEYPGHPVISLGTDVDLSALKEWYAGQFGPDGVDDAVVDGLYTPETIPNEVYCDKPDRPE